MRKGKENQNQIEREELKGKKIESDKDGKEIILRVFERIREIRIGKMRKDKANWEKKEEAWDFIKI